MIEPGDVVAEVDGLPVIALQGAFPLWRTLGPGVEDGKDVLQLEYILASLGYAQEYDVTVDEDWTSATTEAVEAFQEDHGQDDDGEIDARRAACSSTDRCGSPRSTGVARPAGGRGRHRGHATEQSVHVDLDTADADLLGRRRQGRGRAAHRRDVDRHGDRRSGRRRPTSDRRVDASRSR